MKIKISVLLVAVASITPVLLGSQIETAALNLRIEDSATHQPIAGIRVYRFYQTVRVRHFLGIKGLPSPESHFEYRVAEYYVANARGEVRMPMRAFAAQLYERGVADILYINLVAPSSTDDVADARAFAKNVERIMPNLHFVQSVEQANSGYAGAIVHLNVNLPDAASKFDGAYGWFSLQRRGNDVVVRIAPAKNGKVDGRLSSVSFGKSSNQ